MPHTVLLAVTGMSPAIITETLWALARESEPVIPHRVVAVTTAAGADALERELFTPREEYGGDTVWEALRRELTAGMPADEAAETLLMEPPRVISAGDPRTGRLYPLEDIRTPAENETAADFLLEEVRRVTENPDTRLIASLAGGRKTMGGLLYGALSLLGRAQDRLTHVLVNEPFDDPGLRPRFYFPHPGGLLHAHPRTGGHYESAAARLSLADVPFVRLRELFPRQIGRYPGTFRGLVKAYAGTVAATNAPGLTLELGPAGAWLVVAGTHRAPLAGREIPLVSWLMERAARGLAPFPSHHAAAEEFPAYLDHWLNRNPAFAMQRGVHEWPRTFDAGDIRKVISGLRRKLTGAGAGHLQDVLFPRGGSLGFTGACEIRPAATPSGERQT